MSPGDSQFHSRVIVVADRDSDFVKEMDHLVAEYDLAAAQCDDIYSAATELARHPDRFLMVTGVFRQLIRGKGDFFTLAERNGVQSFFPRQVVRIVEQCVNHAKFSDTC